MREEDYWMTTDELAKMFGRSRRTIQKWRDRDYLKPVGYRGRSNLYDYREVALVERERRRRNLRPEKAGTIVGN